MARNTRRLAAASLALGLGLASTGTAAQAGTGLRGILGIGDIEHGVTEDVPIIAGDLETGLGTLLGGDAGLLQILGGTGDLLGGILGGLGLGQDTDLSIQPVPSGPILERPRVGAGLLGNLFGLASITESLAGHL
ncbi:MAG: hypothetical protein ACRDYV_03955 [Acidimicrobiia bacterium]